MKPFISYKRFAFIVCIQAALSIFFAVHPMHVYAANIVFMEPGTDATFDTRFYTNTVGGTSTNTSASDFTNTGPRSLKEAHDSAGSAAASQPTVTLTTAQRMTFYYRVSALPTAATEFVHVGTSSNLTVIYVRINSNGTLCLATGVSCTITGTTVLSTNTWYRIALSWNITSASVNSFKVYLNGNATPEITWTNTTLTNTAVNNVRLGNWTGATFSANTNEWFDDIYIDDGTDVGDPGDIHVTAKRPNANGSSNAFTTQIGSGGSGYGTGHSPQVNERSLSTTNGWQSPTTSGVKTEGYAIESASTGDVNISTATLLGYTGWVYAALTGNGGTPTDNIIVNGTSTAISTTATAAIFSKVVTSATYPAIAEVIGISHSGTGKATALYEAGILFAYNPAAGSLGLTAPSSTTLSAVTLSTSPQTSTGSLGTTTIADTRGTNVGWSLTVTSSNFTASTHTNPVTNFTINPNNSTLAVTSGSLTGVTAGASHTFTSTSDAATVASASSGNGNGTYTINPGLSLSVPVGSYAGTYTATITETLQ